MATKKSKRVAGSVTAPTNVKRAVPGERPSAEVDGHPSWRFEYIDHDFPEGKGWGSMDAPTFKEISEVLSHCEQTPMNRLFQGHAGSVGACVKYSAETLTNKIDPKARKRLEEIGLGDLDHLIRIRGQGNSKRVFAWQGHGNTLNLLWWDRDHEVHPRT